MTQEEKIIIQNRIKKYFPDAYCHKLASRSFVIKSALLNKQLGLYQVTEDEAWESGFDWILKYEQERFKQVTPLAEKK